MRLFHYDLESLEDKDFCIFHDENYLKDNNYKENKEKVIRELHT